jgi:SAM-dependent methyltransferase
MTAPTPHAVADPAAAAAIDGNDAIGLCLAGRISPQVALCRLLLGGAAAAAIATQVATRRPPAPHPRWDALSALLHGRGAMLARLAGEVGRHGGNHAAIATPHAAPNPGVPDPGAPLPGAPLPGAPLPGAPGPGAPPRLPEGASPAAAVAAFFDSAVAFSPEASVALYSLGDPAILAQATAEIMDWLHRRGCIGPADSHAAPPGTGSPVPPGTTSPAPAPQADVLDLGCGIGRLAIAMAPRCRSVLGLDVSAGMVAEARRRCASYPAIRIESTPGTDLDALPAHGFDLILAVDSMPYLVQVGPDALATHVRGAARVLRPGGRLAILNLSFGRPLAQDVAELDALAARHGFAVEVAGERPFALWDAAAFLLRRDAPASVTPVAAMPDAVAPRPATAGSAS